MSYLSLQIIPRLISFRYLIPGLSWSRDPGLGVMEGLEVKPIVLMNTAKRFEAF